jgi:DNA-binding XRE family transcriptional regulator
MRVAEIARERVIATNPRGLTTRGGRIGRDEIVFRVRPETFGERLRRLRTERGLTKDQLAAASGISVPAIKQIQVRQVAASAYTVAQLADALGVSMDYLFLGRGES